MEEKHIIWFYGTDIYMKIDDNKPYIIARHVADHEWEKANERCCFDIETGNVTEGSFSHDERYDDVREWLDMNRAKLLEMWRTKNLDTSGLLDLE